MYRVQVGERDLAVKLITLGHQYTNPVDSEYVCDIPFTLFRPVFFEYLSLLILKKWIRCEHYRTVNTEQSVI